MLAEVRGLPGEDPTTSREMERRLRPERFGTALVGVRGAWLTGGHSESLF